VLPSAVSNGDVIIIVVLVVAPIAAIAFAGAGAVYKEIGKGSFAMDHDQSSSGADLTTRAGRAEQQLEMRQMLEAKAYRQRQRGETPLDVEEEMRKLNGAGVAVRADPALVDEIRQLVIARNARRMRQGKEPLDVAEEVDRQVRDLEGLGQ
jgi:hypothetical protein